MPAFSNQLRGVAWILLAGTGCTSPSETRTEVWPDGTLKQQVTVVDGDPVERKAYDEAGRISKSSQWKDGKPHGVWEAYYPDGSVWSRHLYHEGMQIGAYTTWHPNGQAFIMGQYDSLGSPTGTWRFFDEAGLLINETPGDSIHNPT